MTGAALLGLLISAVAATGVFGGCPPVEPPQWGSVRERVLKSGSLQTIYSCEPGRLLRGHKVLTCVGDGWDHRVPKCIPIDEKDTRRGVRKDLYVGDDPAIDGYKVFRRQQVRRRIGELKRRKMKNKISDKSQSEAPVYTPRANLNETLASRLDLSCFTKSRERGMLQAPFVENSRPAKYARKKNVYPPYNVYLVAVYVCNQGFGLKDHATDRLFCSDAEWIGTLPECVKEPAALPLIAQRCSVNRGGCDHVCEDTSTGVKCSCFEGFRSEGQTCIDVDECAEGTAGCAHLCHNDPGSFRCDCNPGYQLDADSRSCQDVNECLLNNGHGPCQGTCHNLNGTYECTCTELPGYKLGADNHTCEDVDECAENNAGCSHTCLNTPGSVYCLCPDGYTLSEDWKKCYDIDECKEDPHICGHEEDCQNNPGSYNCIPKSDKISKLLQDEDYDAEDDEDGDYGDDDDEGITDIPDYAQCSEGFQRDDKDECVDIDECIEGDQGEPHGCEHICVNEPGDYSCDCRPGYEIDDDGQSCKDVDECAARSSSCSHTCSNTEGSYQCGCPPGFNLLDDKMNCKEEEIEISVKEDCSTLKHPCNHHCQDTEEGPKCICRPGYKLDEIGNTCLDIDECEAPDVCSHICVNTEGSFQCLCPDGMTKSGDNVSKCIDVDECLTKIHGCSHNCTNSHGSYTCFCPKGLKINKDGKTCEDEDECARGDHGCSNDCVNEHGSYKCSCPVGWLLGEDGRTCTKTDECDGAGCTPKCVAEEGNGACVCPIGYTVADDGKTCKDVDECEADEHDCSHDCENTPGSYKCLCPDGLKLVEDGLNCEDGACPEGLRQDESGDCQDIDECAEEDHDCSHECVNEEGTYRCKCPKDMSLAEDGVTCEGSNACLGAPCAHECVQDSNTYECKCHPGYRLKDDGAECEDIDECANSSMHGCSHGCVNTLGSFNCTCPPGFYSLDNEKTCRDINECEDQDFKHSCSHECVNTIGSYNCTCPPGSSLRSDYRSCEIHNPCITESHGCSHVCEHENGAVRCGCPEGFELGDDQKSCQDINECLDASLHWCSNACVNDVGSYHCTCEPGFTLGKDNRTCEDIDECLGLHGCSHICVNEAGTYSCDCPDDHDLGDDDRTCEPLDVCSSGHDCSHICANDKDGGYKCECPVGYDLQGDEKTCRDIDECQTENICSDKCINTQGSYICSCPKGLRLSNDSVTCIDHDECVEDHGCSETCINEHGSFRCTCSPGYTLGDDGKSCQVVDECLSHGNACSHGCVNEDGHYRCTCPSGYLISIDGTMCEDINECAQEENECSDECVNLQGSYRCACPTGFVLGSDQQTCDDVDECSDTLLHGCSHECENYEGGYSCYCPESLAISEDSKTCVDLDECMEDHNCSHICVNVFAGYNCSCPDGHELHDDGRTCHEIDSCGADHGCSHTCKNIVGGFTCECPSGFILGINNKTCEDVDECDRENNVDNPCSHECSNTPGSYVCKCPLGYEIGKDKKTCEDINECVTNNGGCSHLCANTDGGMECACLENYSLLEDDGKTCVEMDLCFFDNGGCSHYCDYGNGTVTCSCPDGMSLLNSNGSVCLEDDECLLNNGGCSDVCNFQNGSVTCSCSNGYRLADDDLATCIDIDECYENAHNCTHICVNDEGSFRCECDEGFTVNDEDQTKCDDIDECLIDNGDCWHDCVNTIGSHYCTCKLGYSFEDDNVTCSLTNGCSINNANCSQHCHNKNGIPECSCSPGFKLGQDGKSCQDVDECEEFENDIDSGCSHRCVNIPGSYYCECPAGYVLLPEDKKTCIDVDECLAQTHNCSHNCMNLLGSYICTCYDGHLLHKDNTTCLDINECAEKNGGCSNKCVNTVGGYSCSCPKGFELMDDEKTCTDIDECKTGTARCSHDCVNVVGSWKCICPNGHVLSPSGSCVDLDECRIGNGGCSHACFNLPGGVKCSCPIGLELDHGGKVCHDINECLVDNGGCSHDCINTDGTFKCSCPNGYHLSRDYKTCVDVNECDASNGGCSHTCVNQNGSFHCKCPFGYHLSADGRTCQDIDECQLNNGGCSHHCTNTPGAYFCDCPTGLKLRGKICHSPNPCQINNGGCEQRCKSNRGIPICSCKRGYTIHNQNSSACVDIDECAAPKHHRCDQVCVNTPGSYECQCNPGFSMKNNTCTDIDECLTGICKKKRCVNTLGSYRCECDLGFEFREGVCTDIDECALGTPCIGRCINTQGSYQCACTAGFQSHGSTCIDINECDWNNGGCPHDCVNTMGSFRCACRPGYTLNPRDNFRCQDVNECLNRNGGCNGDCVNTPGSFYCACSDNLVLASDQRTCVSRDLRCRAMDTPRHAEVRCPGYPSRSPDYPEGARCHVRCRRGFKLEGPHVRHCTDGGKWNGKEPSCQSMPRPFIKCPNDIDAVLPPRQSTTLVSFAQPKSNMDWWRYVDVSPSWGKELHGDLGVGTTVITFTAWSPVTNYTSSCRVVIRVRDTENPQISGCPKSFEVRLNHGERARSVYWSEPLITDNVKVEHIYKSKEPGQLMYAGSYHIRYIATDAAGNKDECHFSVHVKDAELPRDQPQRATYKKMLMCPGKPPQVLPVSAYTWQVPAGCYMRYTKIFSGTYSFQHYPSLQDGYQDTRAAYHEVHPVQRTQTPYQLVNWAPAQFILTLQSVPPFIIESILALALTVLLAVPLISQIQLFFDDSLKTSKSDEDLKMRINAPVLIMHYPTPKPFDAESSSSSILNASSLRSTYSTPALSVRNEPRRGRERLRPPEHSSSYIATNRDLSIVDISSFNYSSYRHKLIETALRKQYGGNYPPGNVILNSINLNAIDSSAEARLNDKYNASFFDLSDEHRANNLKSKSEVEYLHPLDHFVIRPTEKPLTYEKHTETVHTTEDEVCSDVSRPQTPSTPRPVTRRRTNSVGRGCASNASSRCPLSRASSTSPSFRPANGASSRSLSSESARRTSSKPLVTRQLFTRREAKPPRPQTSNRIASPRTPDSGTEPITKKLKATRRLIVPKSVPESLVKPPDANESDKEPIPLAATEVVAKPTPASMIPRPTKSKADQERCAPPAVANATEEMAVVEDEKRQTETVKVIPTSSNTSKKYRGTVSRRNLTPPPAWNNNSTGKRSFNRKYNGLDEDPEQMYDAIFKRSVTPRPRNFERRNSSASGRCGSSPSSGKVTRNSSPMGRPKTANATDPQKMRQETPRKSSLRGPKCRPSGSRTWTDKSSVTPSTSHDGSSHSRNIMSESSSGLLQSIQLPVLQLNLSSSSSVGTCLQKSGFDESCSKLVEKRHGFLEKTSTSPAPARSKIATTRNSRLASARSKHSTEVLNSREVPTTQSPTVREAMNSTKVAGSRAKSEVRNRNENSDPKRTRGHSTGGRVPGSSVGEKACEKKSSERQSLDERIGVGGIEVGYGLGGKVGRQSGIETRGAKGSSAAVIGSVLSSKVPVPDKVSPRNTDEDKRSMIKGKSMTSRTGLSENKKSGKVLKNKEADQKATRSLSFPIPEQIQNEKPRGALDGMEVDSEILFCLDYPPQMGPANSMNTREERPQSARTLIPTPASTRFIRTPTDPVTLGTLRHSASSKSTGRSAESRGLSEVSKFVKSKKPVTEKFDDPSGKGNRVESTIQRSLRNYIKKLKVVLSNENSSTSEEIASLNLTDAILPDMRSVLGSSELNRLVGLLEHVERPMAETDSRMKTVP